MVVEIRLNGPHGYQEDTIKYHLASMANRSRTLLLTGQYQQHRAFVLPLVTSLHPAITMLTPLTKQVFREAGNQDPKLQYVISMSSLVVAYSKLPNLQLLMCKNDQNSNSTTYQSGLCQHWLQLLSVQGIYLY